MGFLKNDYENWKCDDIINWFQQIENGKFAKYEQLKEAIKTHNIGYNKLLQMNDLTLLILGIKDENDRSLIINHVKEIGMVSSNENVHENEILKLKQQTLLQKEEILALKLQTKNKEKVPNKTSPQKSFSAPVLKASSSQKKLNALKNGKDNKKSMKKQRAKRYNEEFPDSIEK